MRKYKFTINFNVKGSTNCYSTVLLVPAMIVDNNELSDLNSFIGEKAIKKAILDVSAIGQFSVVNQIYQGEEINDVFFKMKILGFYTEIIHFKISAIKWNSIGEMKRWNYMSEQYFEQLEWKVEITQIKD
ncbi:hypothetical protein N5919_07505 [Glaesserella parasuis]|uniref:hypothetical protein n=1 Tax=Glaesserella parasuis TaxID=738 RepID=UPI0013DEDF9A|nr:hypothetical protein [Glaesserella parasuis]MDD2170697.1 hypothetical protein [Glaesserella parasuis]MDP0406731.1 hypothetical protein [Glaesserella parasuis]QIE71715.1 hypothetical protein G5C59_00220 [Glaesserella parasuis]